MPSSATRTGTGTTCPAGSMPLAIETSMTSSGSMMLLEVVGIESLPRSAVLALVTVAA